MRIKSFINQVYYFSILAIVIAGISSCKKSNNNSVTSVQLVNASPDAGSINLYLSGNLKTTTPVTFGNSSGYLSAIAGNQTAEIKSSASAAILASTSVNLTQASHYSIFLSGRSTTATLNAIVTQDDLSAPTSGKAKVKFVNTVTSSLNVNLLLNSSTTLFSNVASKTATDFMEVTPGTYPLTVVASSATVASLASSNQTFVSGKIYTVYFRNETGANLGLGVIANN